MSEEAHEITQEHCEYCHLLIEEVHWGCCGHEKSGWSDMESHTCAEEEQYRTRLHADRATYEERIRASDEWLAELWRNCSAYNGEAPL